MTVRKDLVPTILVVDDYVENTLILEPFLRRQGYEVVTANDGEEAVELTEKCTPDVILLDLLLPKMDGFDVCRKLKQERKTWHIPIIIITGLAEKEANVRAVEAWVRQSLKTLDDAAGFGKGGPVFFHGDFSFPANLTLYIDSYCHETDKENPTAVGTHGPD